VQTKRIHSFFCRVPVNSRLCRKFTKKGSQSKRIAKIYLSLPLPKIKHVLNKNEKKPFFDYFACYLADSWGTAGA
jgi:hypothetical protein